MILVIKSDSFDGQLELLNKEGRKIASGGWKFGADSDGDILAEIEKMLSTEQLSFQDLSGIVVFRGPGSFSSLRVGITVANTLSYSLKLPVAGSSGSKWIEDGLKTLSEKPDYQPILPEYGADPKTTQPRK